MKRQDVHRMPPLASRIVDGTGKTLVDAWIQSLLNCQ